MKKLLATLLASLSCPLLAAVTEWTGASGSLWSDGANWSGAAQPANGDTLFFLANPANQPTQNNLTNFAPDSLTFSNAAALTLGGNGVLLGYPTNQAMLAVTLGRSGANATGTFSAAHGLSAGQLVVVSGAGSPFDGYYAATVPNSTQITFTVANSGATSGVGNAGRGASLENLNTATGRTITIEHGLQLVTTQYWNAVNANGVMLFAGNLSGTGHLLYASADTRTALPALRLAGTNSGYTGNLVPGPGTTSGWMLMHPAAMIGGNLDLGNGDRNVWLQGGAGIGTYTFGVGTGPGAINFRSSGQGGLKVTSGDATWDPGNGGDYTLVGVTNARVRLARSLATTNVLYFGNSTSRFVLASSGFTNGFADGGSAVPPLVVMRFALGDDGSPRAFTVGEGANSSPGLMALTRAATGGDLGGRTLIDASAGLVVSSMSQLFNGNLELRNGGTLVLDGLSWSDFAANRSSGFGTGASQWRLTGGGFAARGLPLVIPNDGTAGLTASSFDTNFVLGCGVPDPAGGLYANAPVTLARDTVFTSRRTVTAAGNGPGLTGISTAGVVCTISAALTGAGSLQVQGTANAALNQLSELVLAGTNAWTESVTNVAINSGVFFNSGPGGLHVRDAIVRFDIDAALPSGNGGNPALLGSVQRNGTDYGHGFLLTGGATERVYDLPANMRFLIGALSSSPDPGIFGASVGRSKLQNSTILVHDGGETFSQSGFAGFPLALYVRDGGVLTLGDSAGGPVRFVPSRGQDAVSSPTALVPATAISNRVLLKRGEGTLVLRNLAYTDTSEVSDLALQFVWMLGRGTGGNSGSASYFDGAVRGLAPNDPGAVASNSLAGFWISMRGGVYEIDNSGGGSGTFTRWLSNAAAATNISIGNLSGTTGIGGGGFAAYGGNVVVDLNNVGQRDTNTFGLSNSGFVQSNDPLLLGSQTADRTIELYDHLNLNGATREFRVIDNTNSTGDRAAISGNILGTGASVLNKTASGILELRGSNTYAGGTLVAAGTLVVNNTVGSGTGTGTVAVAAGATVGGSGIIGGSLVSTGTVSPGASIGTLTVQRDYTQSGALNIELGGTATAGVDYDYLSIGNVATLGGALNVTLTNGYTPANGHAFIFITAVSAINGTFATTNLPPLGGGNGWALTYLANAVMLSVTNGGGGPPPPTGYDLYATQITNGLTAPNQDADADGYANLLEYVTGANPTNADNVARLNAARTNGVLALRFTRDTNSVDATLIVEGAYAATNNAAWSGLAVNSNGVWTGATVTEAGANPVSVTVQDIDPAATNRFLRLRVTRP